MIESKATFGVIFDFHPVFVPTVLWCEPFEGMEGRLIGQVRCGSAAAAHAVRAAIQRLQVEDLPATLSRVALTARGAEPGTGHQAPDGREMARTVEGRG